MDAQQRLVTELREADRRKSEFIAVLSHELRNPLAAIRNGLYALERAPGRTTVSLEVDPKAASAVLRVADTGAGIDRTLLDRIFEPFAQADRTLARSMGGSAWGWRSSGGSWRCTAAR